MPKIPKTLIITGFGFNCEEETRCAFQTCGSSVTLIHLNDLFSEPEQLLKHQILVIIGGFSFGDHLGAGTVMANRIKFRLFEPLKKFIRDRKLIFGICNGFQILVRIGLLPATRSNFFSPQATLVANDHNVFRDDWVTLKCNPDSPCVFTKGIDEISLPIRHGEGKFVGANQNNLIEEMESKNLVAMRYIHPHSHTPTQEFPYNPNGSTNAIAGISDPSGRIFGLMPHPEAYISPYNHPHWIRQQIEGVLPHSGAGLDIFQNAVDFIANNEY